MDKSEQELNDWLTTDVELIFQTQSIEAVPDEFELAGTELKFSDLMSDGDIFGAETRLLDRPKDGFWSEVIDNPSVFTDFDLTYSDHEIIIADGESTIYDTTEKGTVIFSNGPGVEIHASQKSLDLFVEIDQDAIVHSDNSILNIYAVEGSSGHTTVTGSLKSLNLHLFSENEEADQDLQVVDEKLIYSDSGKTIVDLKNLDLAIVDINVTFINSSGIDGTDTVSLFLDGPEREITTDTTPKLDHVLFDEEMEINYAHSVEVQLFTSNGMTPPHLNRDEPELFTQSSKFTVGTIEKQAGEAVQELVVNQEILSHDSLFDDPLDILLYDE